MRRALLLASALLLAVGVFADDQVLAASTVLSAAPPPLSPTGSVSLTSVTDALLTPRSSPLMAKNTFAVGNNVVISKSNIIIRKDDDSDSDVGNAAKLPPLARAIEDVAAQSTAATANASSDAVLAMLGLAPTSAAFASLRSQVAALLSLRGDRPGLRKAVAALIDAASQGDDVKDAGKDDKDVGKDDKDAAVGYRTLFRWTDGSRTYVGWRYPLRYWAIHGSPRLGGACGLGRIVGDFFYC